ncbi:MAG: DUF481 domain-containing protein [Desulfobacterales bacterium]|nr:DUF481 domain-containing protein [Desulfobacterales bacterium]
MNVVLKKSFIVTVAFIFVFAFGTLSKVQAKSSQQGAPVENKWISDGKELGQWWKKNAHAYSPTPTALLYHLEGNITGTLLTGNVDADIKKGDTTLLLRKEYFSSMTNLGLTSNKTEQNITNKKTDIQKRDINQMFAYDITDRISAGLGYMWKYDNGLYLDSRDTYYIGSTFSFFNKPPVLLKVGGYYGYEANNFMTDMIKTDFPEVKNQGKVIVESLTPFHLRYNSTGIRFMENMTLMLSEKVIFLQAYDHMIYFKDSDYYHWTGSLTMQIGITKTISFITRYSIDYEKSRLGVQIKDYFDDVRLVNKKFPNDIVWKNTALTMGFNFSL